MQNATSDLPGFRLERLELLNWGTFDGAVHTLEPCGSWALLIGDNGSGKSTAIDALRTLLVPPRMLNYNDVSADGKRGINRDRTRRSYVRGAWASSSTVDSTAVTTQYLREPGVLSAIAALFTDSSRRSCVTLAQVLWEHDEQVKEIYTIATERRSLRDLIEGHTNTSDIKRAARRSGWQVEDSFASYAERMRGALHIPGEKALEVFNSAIGMKEVSDIDGFVRQFMLPAADTVPFIRETLLPHYRTLLDCWTAIVKAERQVTLLRPVAENLVRIAEGDSQIEAWKGTQGFITPYFASRRLDMLRTADAELASGIESAAAARSDVERQLTGDRAERDRVNLAIGGSDAGARLKEIEAELKHAEGSRAAAAGRRARLESSIQLLDAGASVRDAESFGSARAGWVEREQEERSTVERLHNDRASHHERQRLALRLRTDAADELDSVERHRVNIPRDYLALRALVADAASVSADVIPFAGELMEVEERHVQWTGAFERLLGGLGLSLLVPEKHYRAVADFVNRTTLGRRLEFHRVPNRALSVPALDPERVPGRLAFRAENPMHIWLANELVRRFNHRCCDSIAELETTDYGLTREGLIKGGTRHVKDDRRAITDASARVLGWSTDRKIAALKEKIEQADLEATAEGKAARECGDGINKAEARAQAAQALLNIGDFSEIDAVRWSAEIVRLSQERDRLERGSAPLRALQLRLREIDAAILGGEGTLREWDGRIGDLRGQQGRRRQELASCESELGQFPSYDHAVGEGLFADIVDSLPALTLDNHATAVQAAQKALQGRINNEQGKVNSAVEIMVNAMGDFLAEFPDYRQTLEARRAYADDFVATLRRIEGDDLPEHRERFERFLSENLVGDLLMLQHRLDQHQEDIDGRIEEINRALRAISYTSETYVELRLMQKGSEEVAQFRRALRDCFEHGINPAPEQRLKIFDRVRLLLEGFQGDPERTQRITDVRSWFAAGVRERRIADDQEVNYYAATTGKSVGQKAKLAFTILASALSAQYGLSTAAADAPSLRLVVIDEALSRTDETNSTRAMELFKRLGFQMLIVGPFDAKAKLAVPFVQTIHLASNPVGNSSRLVTIAREQVEQV